MSPRAYSYTTSKGVTYFLHAKDLPLPKGREQRIYYFRRGVHADEVTDTLPEGYTVAESRSGLPFVKREDLRGQASTPRHTRGLPLAQSVPALLRELATARGDRLLETIVIAYGLLDMHKQRLDYEWLLADPTRLREFFGELEAERPGHTAEWVRTRPANIREQSEGLVPDGLLDVHLRDSDSEVRMLIDALIRLLQHRERWHAASAASTLAKYIPADVPALPHLTAFLLRCTPRRDGEVRDADDAHGAHQAAYSLEDMLAALGRDGPVGPERQEEALAACRALAHAASVPATYRPPKTRSYVPDPREAAAHALFWTANYYTDRDVQQRLEAQWEREAEGDEAARRAALVCAVTGVEAGAGGVVVDGVLVAGTQPTVGKAVTVRWHEHPPARAVLRDLWFRTGQWPPLVAFLLEGLGTADVGSGAWVTTTFRDQHQGEYTDEQLDRLERMIDPGDCSQDESREILSSPTGTDANDQSAGP